MRGGEKLDVILDLSGGFREIAGEPPDVNGGDRGMAGDPRLGAIRRMEKRGGDWSLVVMDEGSLACATKAPDPRASPVTAAESPGGPPS